VIDARVLRGTIDEVNVIPFIQRLIGCRDDSEMAVFTPDEQVDASGWSRCRTGNLHSHEKTSCHTPLGGI